MPISSSLAYPSDDLTTYQVTTDLPLLQASLGDLLPASGSEPVYPALRIPRVTKWRGDSSVNYQIIKIMCSEADVNWLAGPGTQVTAGGVTWTLQSCLGERRA